MNDEFQDLKETVMLARGWKRRKPNRNSQADWVDSSGNYHYTYTLPKVMTDEWAGKLLAELGRDNNIQNITFGYLDTEGEGWYMVVNFKDTRAAVMVHSCPMFGVAVAKAWLECQ